MVCSDNSARNLLVQILKGEKVLYDFDFSDLGKPSEHMTAVATPQIAAEQTPEAAIPMDRTDSKALLLQRMTCQTGLLSIRCRWKLRPKPSMFPKRLFL
jgi:hypothetical protein